MVRFDRGLSRMPLLIKDGMKLITGNVWAQLIAFVAYIVLARLYSREDFALYNIFYSYIEIFIILSTCKYEQAVVIADTQREATAVVRLALRLNTVVSVVLLLVVLVLWWCGVELVVSDLTPWVALLIPPMVFFCGTSRVYAALFNRVRRFGAIAWSEVINATMGVVFKVAMGFASVLHQLGLPLGTVLGKLAGNVSYWLRLQRLQLPHDTSRALLGQVARKHRRFPLYTMPKELINSLSYNLPFLWLALYFQQAEVGLFAMALTFTFRPINVLNTAFEKLLYVRLADKVRQRRSIVADVRRFILWVNVVALPLFVIAFWCAEPLCCLLFGGRWAGCGRYVRLLLPWTYVMLTATSLMFLSNIFSRQGTEFGFYVVLFVLRIVALAIGLHRDSYPLAIGLFSACSALISLAILVWQCCLVSRYERSLRTA